MRCLATSTNANRPIDTRCEEIRQLFALAAIRWPLV
jgi:hypothetical protein